MFNGLRVDGAFYTAYDNDEGEKVLPLLVRRGCWVVYLSSLWVRVVAASRNLSLQYVDSKICILVLGFGCGWRFSNWWDACEA